jgi:hypothetical protein
VPGKQQDSQKRRTTEMNAAISLVGSKIINVRWMTDEEAEAQGWERSSGCAAVLEMAGGGKIFASRDNEGNGPGVLFGETSDGHAIYITPGS